MAPSNKGKTMQDDVDEMFGVAAPEEDDFADVDDLLNQIVEDDSEGWVPSEEGDAVAGIVVKLGETKSDFATGNENPMVPTVTIQSKPNDEQKAAGQPGTKYRVIGYSTVLKREITDANLQIGDLFAVKYFGERVNRTGPYRGKMSKRYQVAFRHKNA